MFFVLFAFCTIFRAVCCADDDQWQAHDADAIARAIVGANDAGVDPVLQQEVQSVEHGFLLALAIAGVAVLIVLAFCVGYWFGLIAKRGAYETTQLMAQRSGATADPRHGGVAAQFYGTSQLTTGAYQSIQTLGTAIPAPPSGMRTAVPTASEYTAPTVLQHRQASAAATTLIDYNKTSPDRLASLRVERPIKKPNN